MTPADYDAMLASQGGRCAICGRTDEIVPTQRGSGQRRRFCVDHDHDTGRVRGILCNLCNTGIGALRHDPMLLRAAIDYLRREADAAKAAT